MPDDVKVGLAGLTIGEAEAWRAGWVAARAAMVAALDAQAQDLVYAERSAVEVASDTIAAMEPPA